MVKWLLKLRPWLAPTLMLVAVVALGGAWVLGYSKGQTDERTAQELRHAKMLESARVTQQVLADELEYARQERRIVYRDRIRYVDRVIDDCADVPAPDGVLEALRGGDDG